MGIKIFRCDHAGAPSLTGQVGSMIALLDACLVNGYGQVTITSITRSGSTATVVTSAAHGLDTDDWAKIAGAEQAEYNGEFQVTITSATTFTFQVSGTPATPATTASSLTVIRAPGGFDKAFTGTNKAAYRAQTGLRHYLQVLDDGGTSGGAKECRWRGYAAMTDVDTGTEPFPTVATAANGVFGYKSAAASASARPWVLITDGKTFYLQVTDDQSPSPMTLVDTGWVWLHGFGEFNPTKAADPYASFVAGLLTTNQQSSSSANSGMGNSSNRSFSPTGKPFHVLRSWAGVEGAVEGGVIGHGWDETCLGNLSVLAFPHGPDQGFYCTPVKVAQGSMRGWMPGAYEGWHGRALWNGEVMNNVVGLEGKKLMCLWQASQNVGGHILIDITGPWS